MQAKDEDEFVDMLWTMVHHNSGPIAIRYPRGAGTGAKPKETPQILPIGKAEVTKHGTQAALFGLGNMHDLAVKAAALLEADGISTAVINPRWIKPMDAATLEFFARSVDVIGTAEDHVLHNGYGAAVMEHLNTAGIPTSVVRVGWPDEFVEHGAVNILRNKHGITPEALAEKVKTALAARKSSSASRGVAPQPVAA